MNDAEVLAAVRQILDERHPTEDTIRAIKALLDPQREPRPIERDPKGRLYFGTQWERHDDPEMP
jgi:hypothetical protein